MTNEPPVGPARGSYVYVSWIWPLGLTSAPALIVIWQEIRGMRTRRARRLVGRCHKCGYDLRASKDRCPERGTAIPDSLAEPRAQPIP